METTPRKMPKGSVSIPIRSRIRPGSVRAPLEQPKPEPLVERPKSVGRVSIPIRPRYRPSKTDVPIVTKQAATTKLRMQGHISQVPPELFPTIFANLKPNEILHLCQTNKEYRKLCGNDNLWRNLLQRDYPDTYSEYSTGIDKSWFEIYKEAYFLHKRATHISKKVTDKQLSMILSNVTKYITDIKRGDIVEFIGITNDSYIYDGKELLRIGWDEVFSIPEQFGIITEFPPNYWEDGEHHILLRFDANRFMNQLLENSRFEKDTITNQVYIRSEFIHNNIEYTVIYEEEDLDEDDLDSIRVAYESRLYVSNGESIDISKGIAYPKNRTLFLTADPKYSEYDYSNMFAAAAAKGDFVEYKRIADNIDVYAEGSEFLTELFTNPKTTRKELEFWIDYEGSKIYLDTILRLKIKDDDLFYKALKRQDFEFLDENIADDIEVMLESWKKNKRDNNGTTGSVHGNRIRAVLADPRFPESERDVIDELLETYKFH